MSLQDVAAKVIDAAPGGPWNDLFKTSPFIAALVVSWGYVLKFIQKMNEDHKKEIMAMGEQRKEEMKEIGVAHADSLKSLIAETSKREDRLSLSFDRNTRVMSRVLERMREPDPPGPGDPV